MPLTIEQEMVDTLACVGTALEQAEVKLAEKRAIDEKVASMRDNIVEVCVKAGVCEPHERNELKNVLNDHAKAVEFVGEIAKYAAEQVRPIGQPAEHNKTAQHANDYVSGRSSGLRESDRQFYLGLGLQPPTE